MSELHRLMSQQRPIKFHLTKTDLTVHFIGAESTGTATRQDDDVQT